MLKMIRQSERFKVSYNDQSVAGTSQTRLYGVEGDSINDNIAQRLKPPAQSSRTTTQVKNA